MKIRTRKTVVQGLFLALVFILGLSSISWGAEFWLRAETLPKTMPDASVITMWGFANCDNTWACTAPTVPGPRLTVPVGDSVLKINLRSNLTGPFVEPVSIVIPGLTPAAAMTPVKFADPQTRDRVRSFTTETPNDNATTVTYEWIMKPGTYLYESGTHPAVQVQMGLYGAVTSDAAAGQAYGPSTAYSADAILLFSEIDPVIHGHVAAGTYGTAPPAGITSAVDYEPRYFLINGEAFSTSAPIQIAAASGQTLLLRFLSAGLRHRVPTIYGVNLSLVAEDGNLYPYPKGQYSLLLSPGKTIDALVPALVGGEYPVYDRRLGLTNNMVTSGGMLAYLSVTHDLTPPTGTVVINGDAATTNSRAVVLTLNATDPANNLTEMRFSWDHINWLGWVAYATTANATIPFGQNGINTIYVEFRDAEGNVSVGTISDSIDFVDNTPPTGSVLINGGAASTSNLAVTLTLSATDLDNTVTNMNFSWDNSTWIGWEAFNTTRAISIPAGPAGTKTIYVQFRDAVGNVSTTYQDSINYTAAPPIAAPTNLVAVINSGPVRISLSWRDASNNETSFTIWRSDNGGAFTQIGTVTRTSTGSTSTGTTLNYSNFNTTTAPLVAGHTYQYYVIAANASNTSAASNTVTVNFSVPAAPTLLNGASVVSSGTLDTVTLGWTDNSNNESSFQVQRATNSTFTSNVNTYTAAANAITFVQSVSRSLPTLYYRVRAVNGIGNSGWSNTATVTTP